MKIPFLKMNGAGNDFVILDAREGGVALTLEQIREIADRNNPTTHGCDQFVVMELSKKADVFMRIYNADGSQVDACGNATRCVASLLEKETGKLPVTIQTNVGILKGIKKGIWAGVEFTLVDMGKPKLDWKDIPLSAPIEESIKKVQQRSELNIIPHFVNMGNPHVIFFIDFDKRNESNRDINIVNGFLDEIGPKLENSTDIFPERVNISVAIPHIRNLHGIPYTDGIEDIKYRFTATTWERGAGETAACGTAACAMLVAANAIAPDIRIANVQFSKSNQDVNVELTLEGHVLLGGEIKIEFPGILEL